jgi:hypothetical protein
VNEPRSIDDGPWCWQNKAARRRIRDALDATNNVASALATYGALTEIASDEQANPFTTTHAWISRMSGASRRAAQSRAEQINQQIADKKIRYQTALRIIAKANATTAQKKATPAQPIAEPKSAATTSSRPNRRRHLPTSVSAMPSCGV